MNVKESLGKWMNVLDKRCLKKILNYLNIEYSTKSICPEADKIFRAFELCPYDKCKVVFLGQDPYPQKGVATGILFGNKEGVHNLSPSLSVIKDACLSEEERFDITLESWCKQGILMINSALTVEQDKIGSHTLLWRPFIKSFLQKYSIDEPGQVYVLFGKQAQSFKGYINSNSNYIISIEHPAYYARMNQPMPKTLFLEVNKLLIEKYGIPINWSICG